MRKYKTLSLLLGLYTCAGCGEKATLFRALSSDQTGIHFNNRIQEDDTLNVLRYEYIYNGGGVGIADFNNDSLPDIYFTGNRVPNKLYINKGNLKFEDVTDAAQVAGNDKWCKGVSVVDINSDGLQDIYVSAAVLLPIEERKNLLYINHGPDKNGVPHFTEEAAAYGLADNSSTQMCAFFDYDNDGDLDVYVVVNELDGGYPNEFRPIVRNGKHPNTDKLLRNDWNDSLHHPVFTDVSAQAGINIEGYGLGVNITDINNDGWKDIFVSNDYLSNDHLYINNTDGTFTDKCNTYLKHTSRNAMGNDVVDINNDGLPDMLETDMMPADNYRQKLMNTDITYQTFQNSARFGYMHQYPRNTLQLNRGARPGNNDSLGDPVFSDIAYYAGIAQTDWSWAILGVDLNNDGWRDIIITNGLPKDMTDMDFIAYRNAAMARTPVSEMLKQLPVVKINNYLFQNNHDLTFTDRSVDWGFTAPAFSAGMAYADLDNDGDEDLVINNTDSEAGIYENTIDHKPGNNNYCNIQLQDTGYNLNAIGALIHLYAGNLHQFYEYTPYRGYMSSVECAAHFGVSSQQKIDSVVITWPDRTKQKIIGAQVNQTLVIKKNSVPADRIQTMHISSLFTDATKASGAFDTDSEVDFIDFNIQKLLPHKLTQYGPAIAAGDVNNDGREDLIIGGGSPYYATLWLQTDKGSFIKKYVADTVPLKYQDDAGICLFDADNDNDLDLFIASGGCENEPNSPVYRDRFYVNDGKGNFKEELYAFVPNYTTKSCVKAMDYDGDGDLDLFVGGKVLPGSYPSPVSSMLYRNDSKNGVIQFTDVTKTIAPDLINIGMVNDAIFSDADNDGRADLLVTGEWMGIVILKNTGGKFLLQHTELNNLTGWWNSITAADVDNDGDMDYITGNYGTNGFLKPSPEFPLQVYAKDFDNNGSFDAVYTTFLRTSLKDSKKKEFPVGGRDDLIKEMTAMKERFPNYAAYGNADITKLFTATEKQNALQKKVVEFKTGWIENKGNFHFAFHALPSEAQFAPVYGIVASDLNGDGNADLILNGNEFSTAPYLGRYDAFNGLMLLGDGKGNFAPMSVNESGIYIPGNGKAIALFKRNDRLCIAASQNASSVKIFELRSPVSQWLKTEKNDTHVLLHWKNNRTTKVELPYGSSFFSASSRSIAVHPFLRSAEMFSGKHLRTVYQFP